MVAAAERAELVRPARMLADALLDAGMFFENPFQSLLKFFRGIASHIAVVVLPEAHRHVPGDLIKDLLQLPFIEIISGQREAGFNHPSTQVHPHWPRDDGAPRMEGAGPRVR